MLQANNIEEFPILEICTQESRSFVQRMVATFLFKARWRLLSYFFQRCPEFCVKNVASQAIVAMVIFANAIWLAIQTDWRLRLGQEGAVVLACLVLLKWTCDKYSHSRSSSWSCQILLGNFSLQSTWRDDWDGRCVTVSPGTRMLHSKVEWRKPRLKKLMWPLPFGLSEISRSEWTCYL